MVNIADLSAIELLRGYRAGDLSPVEATKAAYDRIAEHNDTVNAFIRLDEETAMAAAVESEKRWSAGAPMGPLDGVPTGLKEQIEAQGWPNNWGSPVRDPGYVAARDSPVVARLREAGAIFLGQTANPEFSWKGVTDSPLNGVTRNPWNIDMTPGGSSGGAAAACALKMGPLHVGSDGGGSVRIPAGYAGLFGLKPTQYRLAGDPTAPNSFLGQAGPITRHVADAALMFTAMIGPDSRDPFVLPPSGVDYSDDLENGIKGLRIGYFRGDRLVKVHKDVAANLATAAARFEELGAVVEEADPGFDNPIDTFLTFWQSATTVFLDGASDEALEASDQGLVRSAERGREITGQQYVEARRRRAELGRIMAAFYEANNYDLLLMPTIPIPAFKAGSGIYSPPDDSEYKYGWAHFTFPFNITGQPAASVPSGFTGDGLPTALQLVAPRYGEVTIFRAAKAYETIAPFVMPVAPIGSVTG